MERLEAEDLLHELETLSPRQFDAMNPLVDLTSGHKNLMCKYLDLHEEEPWPLLAEYFGVALAFAALGALIHGANGNRNKEDVKDRSALPQRMALQTMLKGAMERLQYLAQNAQDLHERLTESTDVKERDRNDWDKEKVRFLRRISNAEEEVVELKKRRLEDAKASEKVVRIYAHREQGWKHEKKKLRHEIDMLGKDLINREVRGLCSPSASMVTEKCSECELKERRLLDLEKALNEKEHATNAATENARIKEEECRKLNLSLTAEKAITSEFGEKLAHELANSAEREKVLDEVRDREQGTECRLAKAEEELESTQAHLVALSLATENHSEMTQNLLIELATLKQESEDKDVMISSILERATVEREEKEDLARQLASAESGKQTAEAESGHWRRLAGERNRQRLLVEVPDASRSGHRYNRSLGNQSEFEKVADMQKSHSEDSEEVNNLHTTYSRQVEVLEKQVAMYRGKAEAASSAPIPALLSADLLEPLSDPAFKAWLEVVKGRFATQLEEKHWNQVETFERHLRAKDERLSAFRSKLITLESELAQSRNEVEDLGCDSSAAANVCPTGDIIEEKRTSPQKSLKVVECVACEKMTTSHQRSREILCTEVEDAKDKLKEKEAVHLAAIQKIAENTESELQHKDAQLAVLEAKLCQVQLQLEETKLAHEMVSPDKREETMFLENIDEAEEPQSEEVSCSTRHDRTDSGSEALEPPVEIAQKKVEGSCEGLIQLDDSVFDSANLLSRLKDLCLKEEKPPAMLRFHKKLELETSDSLMFSTDDCWLTAERKTSEISLQFLPAKDTLVPVKPSSFICIDKNSASARVSPRPQYGRDIKTLAVVQKKAMKGVNKQPLSLEASANARRTFSDIPCTQAPSKGTRPTRLDMSKVLEEQKSQRSLFTEIDGLQSPITNPTFIIQESDEKLVSDEERNKSSTRDDIQVLGLALEVRRIEQQLTQMNASVGNAQTLHSRSVTSDDSPVKQKQRCIGLAGKVSQLAKQIGLTRSIRKAAPQSRTEVKIESRAPVVRQSDLCLSKNPLFLQESSAADLASLQKRADKLGDNLSTMQAKPAKKNPNFPDSRYKPSLFPKGKLVDTVQTHLCQVQGALHSKLTQTTNSTRRLPCAQKQGNPPPKTILTPRKSVSASTKPVSTPTKPISSPTKPVPTRKPISPTNPALTAPLRWLPSSKPTSTPSPRRITSTKLLTPSPRPFIPSKPVTQALSPSEGKGLSPPNRPQISAHPRTTFRDLIKDDYKIGTPFRRKESTKPSIHDQQPPRQWARTTSKHFELDLEHLR